MSARSANEEIPQGGTRPGGEVNGDKNQDALNKVLPLNRQTDEIENVRNGSDQQAAGDCSERRTPPAGQGRSAYYDRCD